MCTLCSFERRFVQRIVQVQTGGRLDARATTSGLWSVPSGESDARSSLIHAGAARAERGVFHCHRAQPTRANAAFVIV
jgi:hypothetical protein